MPRGGSKSVAMIILPFHKQWKRSNSDDEVANLGHSWREVNKRMLKDAPCSVALVVERGFGGGSQKTPRPTANVAQRVCVIFFGGPDDREALELGGRMAEHPAVQVTVIRFIEKEGIEINGVMLRPSPNKCGEESYSFSTSLMNREKEKVISLSLSHICSCLYVRSTFFRFEY